MDIHKRVAVLAEEFASCTKILTALGDETRAASDSGNDAV